MNFLGADVQLVTKTEEVLRQYVSEADQRILPMSVFDVYEDKVVKGDFVAYAIPGEGNPQQLVGQFVVGTEAPVKARLEICWPRHFKVVDALKRVLGKPTEKKVTFSLIQDSVRSDGRLT